MAQNFQDQVEDALRKVIDVKMVSGLQVTDNQIIFAINVNPEQGLKMEPLRKAAEDAVRKIAGDRRVMAVLTAERPAPPELKTLRPAKNQDLRPVAPGVRFMLAVASGKGGVGKSTVAANLACAFVKMGLKTGLLDADIYGPSQPRMFGVSGRPDLDDARYIIPHEAQGLKLMSMGFMVDEETPMIWRGPMVQSAISQMLRDVAWGALDVLVIDLPPGTGDAQLTLAQQAPLAGAVIVSTPQDIALIDAKKGLLMFQKVEVPVLGFIENMSLFTCENCGHESPIFGHDGAKLAAQKMGVNFLGALPLTIDLRETSDNGTPIVFAKPDSREAGIFLEIAGSIFKNLEVRAKAS